MRGAVWGRALAGTEHDFGVGKVADGADKLIKARLGFKAVARIVGAKVNSLLTERASKRKRCCEDN